MIAGLEARLKGSYYRARYHAAWSLGELGAVASIVKLSAEIEIEEVLGVRREMIRVHEHWKSIADREAR